ncbi:MAG: winged helix-turn-helix domain-containing protein [Methanobrevibacter sp.]|jgi:hypothetical protein|nr:winged helix-turn-helix domain-containing protein [Methanobrevibacter sp.]
MCKRVIEERDFNKLKNREVILKEIQGKFNRSLEEITGMFYVYLEQEFLIDDDFNYQESVFHFDERISEEEIEFLSNNIFIPLSHPTRVKIFRFLFSGSKCFSDISKTAGISGGNLRFHINTLVDANLILKNKITGDYGLTINGLKLKKAYIFLRNIL